MSLFYEQTVAQRDKLFVRFGEPKSLDELGSWVVAVINDQLPDPIEGLAWDLSYNPHIKNRHCAPLGETTNWHQHKEKPTGFAGFYGRVWIRFKTKPKDFSFLVSSIFNNTVTHVGTGGFGMYGNPWMSVYYSMCEIRKRFPDHPLVREFINYSWDYRFFLQDFPALQKTIEQDKLIKILSNYDEYVNDHIFRYCTIEAQHEDSMTKQFAKKIIDNEYER